MAAASSPDHRGEGRHPKAAEAAAYSDLGDALRTLGKSNEAEKVLGIARNLKAGHPSPPAAVSEFSVPKTSWVKEWTVEVKPGDALRDANKNGEAIAFYREIIKRNPNNALARQRLGDSLFLQGKLDEAIASYQATVLLLERLARAGAYAANEEVSVFMVKYLHNNLGVALRRRDKPDDAIAHLWRAVELDPLDGDSVVNLGDSLRDAGKLDEAIAFYQTAIQLEPDEPLGYNSMGNVLTDQYDFSKAIEYYRKAMARSPTSRVAYNNLLLLPGKLHKEAAEALCDLGASLSNQGKLVEATAVYNYAVNLAFTDADGRGLETSCAYVLVMSGMKLCRLQPPLSQCVAKASQLNQPDKVSDVGADGGLWFPLGPASSPSLQE